MAGGRAFGTRTNFSRTQPPVYQQQSPANTRPYQAPWLLDNPGATATPQSIHDQYSRMPAGGVGPYAPIVVNGMYADSAATRRSNILKEMHGYQERQARQQEINPSGTGLFSVPPEQNPANLPPQINGDNGTRRPRTPVPNIDPGIVANPAGAPVPPRMTFGGKPVVAPSPEKDQFSSNFQIQPGVQPNGRAISDQALQGNSVTGQGASPYLQSGLAELNAIPHTPNPAFIQQQLAQPQAQNPAIDLSGMQGAPTAQGMGVAGMMPGYGGMAAQGYMAALGKGYQASQRMPTNEMRPALPGEGQSVRALNAITDTPQPQTSLQAAAIAENNPMMNQSVAGMSNGYYSPPSSVNQGRAYGLTLPMDQAGQANRIANQNPMYEGMQDRFGAGSVMGQQAATIAAGDAASSGPNATMYDIPGSYGEMPTYNPLRPSPEVRTRSNNRTGAQVSFNSNNDPVLTRQQAALRNFRPNAERGANRKAAREATQARLTNSRFKLAVSRGMNPMSPQAKAMFPEQTGGLKVAKNPAAVAAGPPGSLEAQMDGASRVAKGLAEDKHLIGVGATPESTLQDINEGVAQHLATGGSFSDESLKAFQDHAKARASTRKGDHNPFAFSSMLPTDSYSARYDGQLWEELSNLPDTPEARKSWLDKYKSREADLKNKRFEESEQTNTDYPPVNPFPGFFSGGTQMQDPAKPNADPHAFRLDRPIGL